MRILLLHNTYQVPGGEEVVVEQECRMLEAAGHQVIRFTRSNFEAEQYSGLNKLALVRNISWSEQTASDLRKVLRKDQPDVVHVHNTFMMMSPSVYAACREEGVPVVQTLHNYRMFCPAANFVRQGKACEECAEHSLWRGIGYGCYRDSKAATATVALMIAVQRARKAYPDLFIALSEFSRQRFVARGVDAGKICVKPNFVSPDPGERTGDGAYAAVVGRLSSEKGLPTLLDAWTRMNGRVPLKVVGDGPMLDETRQRAAHLGLGQVEFCGRLPRAQAIEILKGSRFLVASSECYENFPMGIAEAFACGVPVVCSRLGAMQEIVEDGQTGLHFTPGDAADLAAKVEWAWSHGGEMRAMGHKARSVFEQRYTAERNYPLLMDVYRRLATTDAWVATREPVAAQ